MGMKSAFPEALCTWHYAVFRPHSQAPVKGLGMSLSLTLSQGLHSGSLESGHTQQTFPPLPFVLLLLQHAGVLDEVKDILASYKITKLRGKKAGWKKAG